ncbi:FAD-binding domain-containing protein [Lactarius akahatsu]|uniref:FAD-binding domain-containing protein n=1 Tax=Lactarius akahatsu TaxID=416441 RepID=A0AAD4Q2Z9_9AGAM|nr:FAD-binding domain-containing protein [Lactarius akahatsu]
MLPTTSLLCALSLAALACGYPGTLEDRATLVTTSRFNATCHQIAAAISNASEVFYPPSPQYVSDISHTYASSSQASICSVEPGSADDLSKILRIIGSTRTPFAVKGGGHASNPGFSSTRGVQISLARFDKTAINSTSGTVELGPGLTWDQVYTALDPAGVNVIGARIPGVGVAGVTLGGGFSYKSNEYGLSVDNVVSYDLVLPNGTITSVTSNDTDLWFGLRGGLNNFGIVTNFVVKSYPQTKVWGGFMFYPPNQLAAVKDALVRYQRKQDIKASAAVLLNYGSGQLLVGSFLFYDAPVPPQGLFDDFLTIPTTSKNISTTSFADLILLFNQLNPSPGSIRNYFCGVPVTQYSPAVFDAFVNQTKFWGAYLASLDKNATVGVTLEPFDSGVFSHGSGSAYPPDRSQAIFPSVLGYTWTNASIDGIVASAMRKESAAIHAVALADGQNVSHAAVYVNYALFGTPLEDIYGQNVPRLRKIRAAIDPEDVMGLAGGFKF